MIRGAAGAVGAAIKLIDKKTMFVSAVIVAAGSSSRMNGVDKLFAPLKSEPLLAATVRVFQNSKTVNEIVLVMREEDLARGRELCAMHGLDKVTAVVAGGKTRADSSGAGLASVSRRADIVLIHDGDRPFADQDMIFRTVSAASRWGAAAAAVPVTSTVKRAVDDAVTDTVSRKDLYEIQTPQAFQLQLLKAARKKVLAGTAEATDDCMMVEAMGVRPVLVDGSRLNIKITFPEDLVLAEAIADRLGR